MSLDLRRGSHNDDTLCRWWNGEYDHGATFCHEPAEWGTEACAEHREDCQDQPCGEPARVGTATCPDHEAHRGDAGRYGHFAGGRCRP